MPPSPASQDSPVDGIERLGDCLSHIRKRPGMYFGSPPYLMHLCSLLNGYELAEDFHGVGEKHFEANGFSKWLHSEKGLEPNPNLGWIGIIEAAESDPERQLDLAIDYFAEYAGIPIHREDASGNKPAESGRSGD